MGMLVFRYFCTGQSFHSLVFSFWIDPYTVGKVVDQVSDVLCSKVSSKHLTVPDHDRVLDKALKFQERWNFPNIFGCTDGSTFALNVLQKLEHCFTITNNFFLLVLQGIAASESRFIVIDIGDYHKQSDCRTFSVSTLYHYLEDSESTLPKSVSDEKSGTEMPFLILGDESSPKDILNEAFCEKGTVI